MYCVTPDVPAVLGATAGALPTLVLALLLETPLLSALSRTAARLRERVDKLETQSLGRWLLRVIKLQAGGVTLVFAIRHWDIAVLLLGVLGTLTSIGLLALPASAWTNSGTAWAVVSAHFTVVVLLGGTVARGAAAVLVAARAAITGDEAPW